MGRAGSAIAFLVAGIVTAVMVAIAYGLTSEYGYQPNGGGLGEALVGIAASVPGALLVGALVSVGSRGRRSRNRRVMLGVTAGLAAVLAVALGIVLGQRQLEARCEERGQQHSAACPGYTGIG